MIKLRCANTRDYIDLFNETRVDQMQQWIETNCGPSDRPETLSDLIYRTVMNIRYRHMSAWRTATTYTEPLAPVHIPYALYGDLWCLHLTFHSTHIVPVRENYYNSGIETVIEIEFECDSDRKEQFVELMFA